MKYRIIISSSELQHHGILGQKWGIRRFQNPDGSLTAAGKRRYAREIKRGFDKQRTKEFRAVMRGDKDAIRNTHKNETWLQKKIVDEVKKSKEYKEAYDVAVRMNNSNDRVLDKSLINEWNTKQRAYSQKIESLCDEYYSDILGAKLKDIGLEDTAIGREEIQLVLSGSGWWPDFKYDTAAMVRGD